ncbi:hypothetical protein [Caldalkalibacillus mannanilyticus]|uniref:hypothetical protein n=1 Tax=Caldalkalibacillus mannanilyticus TaxID=1418 RepID=UPI0004696578|nr:hypothetical protein [Caldalkalibacillus mannanilyticus]
MKKKLWLTLLLVAIIVGGVYFFITFDPPLEIGTLASSKDHKSVVVGMGNKGLGEVKIVDVSVNNNEKPSNTKIQVSNALQGFIITNDYTQEEEKEFGFTNIDDVVIRKGTAPSTTYKKLDDGIATKDDEIYGISVFHSEEIQKVHIKYSYLGILFHDTVIFKMATR